MPSCGLVVSFVNRLVFDTDIVLKIVIPNLLLRILTDPLCVTVLDDFLANFNILLPRSGRNCNSNIFHATNILLLLSDAIPQRVLTIKEKCLLL